MQVNSVAIIGAGPGGLVAAKEAKACGLNPIIFEKGKTLGGQWSAEGAVWDNMKLNNSLYSSSFSDHDWKEGTPDFPNRLGVYEYLFSYATKFNIIECIKLNCAVTNIKQKSQSIWRVKWINETVEYKSHFNFIMVCSGLFSMPYSPLISGIKTFTGTLMHSSQYKNADSFVGKRVAIIGNSYSAHEISSDIAKKAKETIHIFRRAVWICSRYTKLPESNEKIPVDLTFSRSGVYSISKDFIERNRSQNAYFSKNFVKQSEISPLLTVENNESDPPFLTISDDYLNLVEENKITLKKSSIKKIEGGSLILSDETAVKVDVLIFCTGYRTSLPFCSQELKNDLNFDEKDPFQPLILYKATIHPQYPSLAFLGLMRVGVYSGVLELQARYASMLFSQNISLPSKEIIELDMQKEWEIRNRTPRPQFSRGSIVLSDELAKEIGVYPDSTKLDQQLFNKVWTGTYTVASYRLTGPHAETGLSTQRIDKIDKIVNKEKAFIGNC